MLTILENKKGAKRPLHFLRERNEQGFTLMEVVITVAVILILSIGGFMAYEGFQSKARDAAVESAAQEVYTGASAHRMNKPTTDLDALAAQYNTSADGIITTIDEGANDICVSAVLDGAPEHAAQRGDCDTSAGDENAGDDVNNATYVQCYMMSETFNEQRTRYTTDPFYESAWDEYQEVFDKYFNGGVFNERTVGYGTVKVETAVNECGQGGALTADEDVITLVNSETHEVYTPTQMQLPWLGPIGGKSLRWFDVPVGEYFINHPWDESDILSPPESLTVRVGEDGYFSIDFGAFSPEYGLVIRG